MENLWPALEGISPGGRIIIFLILTVGTIAQRYLAILSKKADAAIAAASRSAVAAAPVADGVQTVLSNQEAMKTQLDGLSERVGALEARKATRAPRTRRRGPDYVEGSEIQPTRAK